MLYCIVWYGIVSYSRLSYSILVYSIVFYCITLSCIILCHIMLCHIILEYIILYHMINMWTNVFSFKRFLWHINHTRPKVFFTSWISKPPISNPGKAQLTRIPPCNNVVKWWVPLFQWIEFLDCHAVEQKIRSKTTNLREKQHDQITKKFGDHLPSKHFNFRSLPQVLSKPLLTLHLHPQHLRPQKSIQKPCLQVL